ncbi:MAG TPA: hypothetical protein VG406_11460 [Isosphaeraceae bacterium]|jgi:hypothetical protein|nr:hypothetical protein [Isosphaeraceae bacterium]
MSRQRRSFVVRARGAVGLVALVAAATVALARQEPTKAVPLPDDPKLRRDDLLELPEPGPLIPDDDALAGLLKGGRLPVLTLRRAYELALIRHRAPRPPGPGDRLSGLDPKTIDSLGRRSAVADFARFRQDYLARKGDAFAFRDPAEGFLDLLVRLHAVGAARRLVMGETRLLSYYQEQADAKVFITQLQVDQLGHIVEQDRVEQLDAIRRYRNAVDDYKVRLGLPPQAPLVIDRAALAPLHDVFRATDQWKRRPERRLEELPAIIVRLPALPDITIAGRPLLGTIERDPAALESMLRLATEAAAKAQAGRPADDSRALRIRRLVREQIDLRLRFKLEQRSYALALRVADQMVEQMVTIHVPVPGEPATPVLTILEVIQAPRKAYVHEDRLVQTWTAYQSGRLNLLREIGIFPYTDWDSYLADILPPPAPKAPEAAAPAPKAGAEPLPPPPNDR